VLAQAYLFPPLSVGGASLARACPEHQRPLVEPCVRFARTRLSDHRPPPACTGPRPAWHSGLAATGDTPEVRKRGHSLAAIPSGGLPVSGGVKVRPLPSTEVMLSSICQRYYEPLRLPGQPGGDFGVCLIRPGWPPVGHWPGSPVVPPGAILACHPWYPGGPHVTWQQWRSPGHRSSPSGNGVDALTELTRLHLGSLHATACEVAHVHSNVLVRELGASGYPSHLPQATRPRCPLPGPDFHRQVPEYPRHTTGNLLRGQATKKIAR